MLGEAKFQKVPREAADFFDYLNKTQFPVYIFGADIAGKAVSKLLSQNGSKVQGFIENNQNKCFVGLDGIYVFHSNSMIEFNKNSVILIASTYIADIISQVEALGFQNWAPISF